MKDRLIQYVDLLFAGAEDAGDIKQEILQNTLDRYDDLISQGKSPEAAYRLAISGIGDISEILDCVSTPESSAPVAPARPETDGQDAKHRKNARAVAIGMYILCPIPLFILSEFGQDTLGLCMTLLLVAAATVLMVLYGKEEKKESETQAAEVYSPQQELRRSIRTIIRTVSLVAYFLISFSTSAWHVTWLIFPISGAVQGLVNAILDLTGGAAQ